MLENAWKASKVGHDEALVCVGVVAEIFDFKLDKVYEKNKVEEKKFWAIQMAASYLKRVCFSTLRMPSTSFLRRQRHWRCSCP